MRSVLIGLAALAIGYGLVGLALFLGQRRILFRADRTRPDLARAGVAGVREITVKTRDGLDLLAWYSPPSRSDGLVVLHLHGNAGHIGHRAWRLGPFAKQGWGVLLLEWRGYGGNPGRPSEPGLLRDASAGLAALLAMGIPADRVLIWGESLGSGVAVSLAVEHAVAAVVLEAPYSSMIDMAWSRYPFVPVRWLLRDRFDSRAVIARVRAPVLVLHGALDRIIPVAMGRALFDAAPAPKEMWIAAEAGHVDLIEFGAVDAAAAFVAGVRRPVAIRELGVPS